MKRTGCMTILIFLSLTGIVSAQESRYSSDNLKEEISVGDKIRVIDKSGNVYKGKVENISSESLKLKGRKENQPLNSIQVIQKKRKDTLWNGILIGAGTGAIAGALLSQTQCSNDSECSAIAKTIFIPAGMGIGMATGALIDRSISRYDTVFSNDQTSIHKGFRISPIFSHDEKGIQLSIAF